MEETNISINTENFGIELKRYNDLPPNASLADYIKSGRTKYNLSQRELERRTDIDNSMISKIENGKIKKPSYEIIKKLSSELNINLLELLSVAKYTTKELTKLGLLVNPKKLKGTDKIEDYIVECEGQLHIDLIDVFESYSRGYLELEEVFGLFMFETGIDLEQLIPKEIVKMHSLESLIEELENDD